MRAIPGGRGVRTRAVAGELAAPVRCPYCSEPVKYLGVPLGTFLAHPECHGRWKRLGAMHMLEDGSMLVRGAHVLDPTDAAEIVWLFWRERRDRR